MTEASIATSRLERVDRIKAFFFKAMLEGWVADNEPDLPYSAVGDGWAGYSSEGAGLRLEDRYFTVDDSNKSGGWTMIWENSKPVWYMQYSGKYPPKLLPYLKLVLRQTYLRKAFFGGRGPEVHNFSEELSYYNRGIMNNFEEFAGEERVECRFEGIVGYHTYSGMILF